MNKYIKIMMCGLITMPTLKSEINKRIFDIDEFKGNFSDYLANPHPNLITNCISMLDNLSKDVPSELKATYNVIKNITRNVFDTANILYVQKPDPKLVKKSVDDLVKEQSSAKRSFFGTKFMQGAKNLFSKKDDKKLAYNDLKKLFDAIFDILSNAINKIKNDTKTYKPLVINKTKNLNQAFDEINPSWR